MISNGFCLFQNEPELLFKLLSIPLFFDLTETAKLQKVDAPSYTKKKHENFAHKVFSAFVTNHCIFK